MKTGPMELPSGDALHRATIEELFIRAGALRQGHFVLKSGLHSERYLEKFAVLQFPMLGVEIGRRMSDWLAAHDPTLVVGPTTGGVLLAFEVARQLEDRLHRTVRDVFAEPIDPGRRALRRGWLVTAEDRIVLVDDILTTGASIIETADAVREAGGTPLAAAVIADRSNQPFDPGFPVHSLGRIEIDVWETDECPLCYSGEPVVRPGSS